MRMNLIYKTSINIPKQQRPVLSWLQETSLTLSLPFVHRSGVASIFFRCVCTRAHVYENVSCQWVQLHEQRPAPQPSSAPDTVAGNLEPPCQSTSRTWRGQSACNLLSATEETPTKSGDDAMRPITQQGTVCCRWVCAAGAGLLCAGEKVPGASGGRGRNRGYQQIILNPRYIDIK